MLKSDYILGTFEADVKNWDSETITVDDKDIKIVPVTDPDLHQQRLWAKHDIDIVIEVRKMLELWACGSRLN